MQPLVQLAQAFADESRLRILTSLLAGEATVSDLVTQLSLPQPRVSTHLAHLHRAGLVTVTGRGRQRIYRCDVAPVGALLTALRALAPSAPAPAPRSAQAARAVRRNTALRQARTCYDHLAGVAGVQLLDAMLQCGWLAGHDGVRPRYDLTSPGAQALLERGVDIGRASQTRRAFAFGCLDWTERRPHLGGALGATLLKALEAASVIRRERTSRTLVLLAPILTWLDHAAASNTPP